MTTKAKSIATFLTLSGLVTLAVADAVLTVDNTPFLALFERPESVEIPQPVVSQSSSSSSAASQASSVSSASSSTPAVAVGKAQGPDVSAVITSVGLTAQATQDPLFLPRIVPADETEVRTAVLLNQNERAGIIAWTESPKVKIYFLALKEALHESFTPKIADLIDESQKRDGFPPRNFLTFKDTGITEERIAFARVRERMYEIHITDGQEEIMFKLLDELSK